MQTKLHFGQQLTYFCCSTPETLQPLPKIVETTLKQPETVLFLLYVYKNRETNWNHGWKRHSQHCTANFQTSVSCCCSARQCFSPGSPACSVESKATSYIKIRRVEAKEAGQVLPLPHPISESSRNGKEWLDLHSLLRWSVSGNKGQQRQEERFRERAAVLSTRETASKCLGPECCQLIPVSLQSSDVKWR